MVFDSNTEWYTRIKLLRVSQNFFQEDVAEQIGVPVRSYQRWEQGHHVPVAKYRHALAEVLNADENDIFGDDPQPINKI